MRPSLIVMYERYQSLPSFIVPNGGFKCTMIINRRQRSFFYSEDPLTKGPLRHDVKSYIGNCEDWERLINNKTMRQFRVAHEI